jgi:16S rRNA (guanine527-N7)-methyltransferase
MNTRNSPMPASEISADAIAATLAPFYSGLNQEQIQSIKTYLQTLLEWNKSINLTAIEDPVEVLARHFGESLFGVSLLRPGKSRLADVGTGAGFPGLAIKIASPDTDITLFESNSKKRAFLTEIVQKLGISGVRVMRERYEDFRPEADRFDFVCARALGDFPRFIPWARGVLKPEGKLALWLGTDESIRVSRRTEFMWDAPVPIPESRRRVILVGRSVAS